MRGVKINNNIEYVPCAVCNIKFPRRTKPGKLRRINGVRKFGAKTCSSECSKRYGRKN